MAFLGRALKVDLKCLAEELGETATEDMRVTELKKIILASTEYEEEFVKELLKRIASEREEIKRQQKEDEIRRQEYGIKQQEREYELKRQEQEIKRQEQEREDELKRQEREYELERLKIEASLVHTGTIGEMSSSRNEETREHVPGGLQKLMRTFDPKEGDISFYLILFERQARRVHRKEEDWVTPLVGLLPLEMANLIAREAYAIIWALQRFETLLCGAKINLLTDHNPLVFLTRATPQSPRLQRWVLAIQRHDIKASHIKGSKISNADALSRL